jgi:hypothetical protein
MRMDPVADAQNAAQRLDVEMHEFAGSVRS